MDGVTLGSAGSKSDDDDYDESESESDFSDSGANSGAHFESHAEQAAKRAAKIKNKEKAKRLIEARRAAHVKVRPFSSFHFLCCLSSLPRACTLCTLALTTRYSKPRKTCSLQTSTSRTLRSPPRPQRYNNTKSSTNFSHCEHIREIPTKLFHRSLDEKQRRR